VVLRFGYICLFVWHLTLLYLTVYTTSVLTLLLLLLPPLCSLHLVLLQLQERTAELTLQVQQYSRQVEEALRRMAQLQQE
jgi:hypothetical protein